MATAAIILAAGANSRWQGEGPKALAELAGATFVDRVARAALAAGFSPVVRVLGAHAAALQARPTLAGVDDVVHTDWVEGMGSSLACGLAAVLERAPETDAVCVLLADQPLIEARHLLDLQAGMTAAGKSIGLCDYGDGSRGPPAIFLKTHFAALLALTGDAGARQLARSHPEAVFLHPLPTARHDVDSLADYTALLALRQGGTAGTAALKVLQAKITEVFHHG
jgi:molybdenum cofactor cytidylyltransferase